MNKYSTHRSLCSAIWDGLLYMQLKIAQVVTALLVEQCRNSVVD